MAEAHAKLHLRNYVSDSDVQAATQIMLQCFINTQKASVRRSMEKVGTFNHIKVYKKFACFQKFQPQLNYEKNDNDLLLYHLKQLVHDQVLFERSRHGQTVDVSTIIIDESEFVERVNNFWILNFDSEQFIKCFRRKRCESTT